jgi:acyl dehydratase
VWSRPARPSRAAILAWYKLKFIRPTKVPDRTSTVVLVDQSLDVKGMQKQLRTVNRSQAR